MHGRLIRPPLLTNTSRRSAPDASSHTSKLPVLLPVSKYLLLGVTAMAAMVVPLPACGRVVE